MGNLYKIISSGSPLGKSHQVAHLPLPMGLRDLNRIQLLPNENANNVLNAILALIVVLIAHDILEGFLV